MYLKIAKLASLNKEEKSEVLGCKAGSWLSLSRALKVCVDLAIDQGEYTEPIKNLSSLNKMSLPTRSFLYDPRRDAQESVKGM